MIEKSRFPDLVFSDQSELIQFIKIFFFSVIIPDAEESQSQYLPLERYFSLHLH